MKPLSKRYKMDATYWEFLGTDEYGGATFKAPVPVKCHWEEKHELYYNQVGDEKISKAIVWVPIDMKVGGYLALTETTQMDPFQIEDAGEIKGWEKIPDIHGGTDYERKAIL